MKKITLTFIATFVFIPLLFAQFPEGFETTVPPNGWLAFRGSNNEGVQNDWESSETSNTGSFSAYVEWEDVSNEAQDWLVTPQFTPTTSANILEFFEAQCFITNWGSTYEVLVSTTSQSDISSFTVLEAYTEQAFSMSYTPRYIDLSAYNNTPIYIAFKMSNDDGDCWLIDDVNVISDAASPDCTSNPVPANAASSLEVPDGDLILSWTPAITGDPANVFEVFFGTESGNLSSLGTTSVPTFELSGLQASTTYFWRIVPSNVGGGTTACDEWSFTTADPPTAPVNNIPSGAILLMADEGSTCGANAISNVSNASTTDSGVTIPVCGNYASSTNSGDIWYQFVAPNATMTLNFENVSGITSMAAAYYSGTVGNLLEEGCNDVVNGVSYPWEITGLTVGNTYYLRVWDFGNNEVGTFDLCAYYVDCVTAEINTDVAFDCDNNQFSVLVNFTELGDATAVSDGTTTYNITNNQAIAGPYNFGSSATLTIIHSDTDCDFSIDPISFAACPPPNDACSDATAVTSLPFNEALDASAATNNDGFINTCITGMNDGVWYTFTPESSGTVDIVVDNVAGWDAELALYSGSCGALSCVTRSDSSFTGGSESLSDVNVNAGDTYFINVGSFSGGTDFFEGPFEITVTGTITLSMEDFETLNFSLFPNPATAVFQLRGLFKVDEVTVYNIVGQELLSLQPKRMNPVLDISSLPAGTYFLQIAAGASSETLRLIKK